MLYEGVQVNTKQTSESRIIPAPVGGLNGRDSYSQMEETDAYEMDNIFPGTATCKVRNGCAVHISGLAAVYSLDSYGGTISDQLLATGGDGTIKDITNFAAPITLKSGLFGKETITTMFSTVADVAHHMVITTEGADDPMKFDGTTITDLVFTGMTHAAQDINHVCAFKGRLFWGVKDVLGFYYLPPGQLEGVMEYFDLAQICHQGGYMIAMATYSEDAGDGPNDYIIFVTSRGEYIMYSGTDPGDIAAWELVGRYEAATPIGRKCLLEYAGDVIIMTLVGALPFSKVRNLSSAELAIQSLTAKLGDRLQQLNTFKDTHGWSMCVYPKGGWLLMNVPTSFIESGRYYHFIMNVTTHSWTRYWSDQWDGLCWTVANDNLYFGRFDGSVRVADTGLSDIDDPITVNCKQAYNYFNTFQYKHFKWAKFLLRSDNPVSVSSQLSVDFEETTPSPPGAAIDPGTGSFFDVAFWDAELWGRTAYTQRFTAAYGRYGVAGSHWFMASVKGATLEWFSTEHVFEKAAGLLG